VDTDPGFKTSEAFIVLCEDAIEETGIPYSLRLLECYNDALVM
jgi:hypothetical protein